MGIFLLVVFGLIGGLFGGMGMGGGTVIIPLLTIFLSINQKLAQGYNLFSFLIMSIFALIIHYKNKLVDFKSIIWIVVFGTIFCVGGAFLTTVVETTILQYIFAIFLVLLALYEFYKVFNGK